MQHNSDFGETNISRFWIVDGANHTFERDSGTGAHSK